MAETPRPIKRPESVLIVVYTADCDVLLLERVRPAAFWQSVTGSMHWQETDPMVTARRELAEETGLSGELPIIDCQITQQFPIKPEWRVRYGAGVIHNTEHVFRLGLPAKTAIILNPAEHREYIWLPRDAAAAKTASYTNRDAILRFVN